MQNSTFEIDNRQHAIDYWAPSDNRDLLETIYVAVILWRFFAVVVARGPGVGAVTNELHICLYYNLINDDMQRADLVYRQIWNYREKIMNVEFQWAYKDKVTHDPLIFAKTEDAHQKVSHPVSWPTYEPEILITLLEFFFTSSSREYLLWLSILSHLWL
jgi:hypothetical protein